MVYAVSKMWNFRHGWFQYHNKVKRQMKRPCVAELSMFSPSLLCRYEIVTRQTWHRPFECQILMIALSYGKFSNWQSLFLKASFLRTCTPHASLVRNWSGTRNLQDLVRTRWRALRRTKGERSGDMRLSNSWWDAVGGAHEEFQAECFVEHMAVGYSGVEACDALLHGRRRWGAPWGPSIPSEKQLLAGPRIDTR